MPIIKGMDIIKATKSLGFISLFIFSSFTKAEPLGPIYVVDQLIDAHQRFTVNKDISKINDYQTGQAGREIIELLILHQALALGGYRGDLHLVPQSRKRYDQRLKHLAYGRYLAAGHTIWKRDSNKFSNQFYLSDAVIRDGEYLAGVYALADNQQLLSINKPALLTNYRAVSSRQWLNDWHALEELNIKSIHDTNLWGSHLKMLATHRADFILLPLHNTPDLSVHYDPETYKHLDFVRPEGVRLAPVPNLAVAISGSRHFAISKAHPQGEAAFMALQTGLKLMRKRGLVTKALAQSGFFEAQNQQWPVINRPLTVSNSSEL